ncbi:MAG: AraC family transcriptional regulator [Cyanobacteria bacterium J06642_2]
MVTRNGPKAGPTRDYSPILPRSPILSSFGSCWEKVQLALHCQPAHHIPEHRSSHHVICINTGAPVTLQQTVDGKSKTTDSVPRDISIYPAHLWQTFQWDREASFLQLYLEPTLLSQAGAELCDREQIELIPQLASRFDPLIYEIAIALKTSLDTENADSKLYTDAMANALAAHLITHYSTQKPIIQNHKGRLSKAQLDRVIGYIYAYFDRNLSLAELADIAQLSPYHFARAFKQSTGISPHQFHIRCRIDRAKQLLLEQKSSIADVAYAVGFANQGHLNYHFKRRVGMTPKQFLQQ